MGNYILEQLEIAIGTELEKNGLSQSTIYQFSLAFRSLKLYFQQHKHQGFSKTLCMQFIEKAKKSHENKEIKEWRYKLLRRATMLLVMMHEEGTMPRSFIRFQCVPRGLQLESERNKCILVQYLASMAQASYGDGSIGLYSAIVKRFLLFTEEGRLTLENLTYQDIKSFFPYVVKFYRPTSMRVITPALRHFLSFLYEQELIKIRLAFAVPSIRNSRRSIIPLLTKEEERRLRATMDDRKRCSFRNKAVILLALRTGIRQIDICRLKRSDIDWRGKTISFIQKKTNNPQKLPLLPEVGNAIADYMLLERPMVESDFIFMTEFPPFRSLKDLYGPFETICRASDIRTNEDDRKGLHLLRHTNASRMLEQDVPVPLISAILGHSDRHSTETYLSTDDKHMLECAMPLDGIPLGRRCLK